MENNLSKAFEEMKDVCRELAHIHEQSMLACQDLKINKQGHKDWHACKAKEYYDKSLEIGQVAMDMELKTSHKKLDEVYHPSSLEEHYKMFIPFLDKCVKRMGKANELFRQNTGIEYKLGAETQVCIWKDYYHLKRWQVSDSAAGWSEHDLFVKDDKLHKSIKGESTISA